MYFRYPGEEAGFAVRERYSKSLYSFLEPPLADTLAAEGLPEILLYLKSLFRA